MGARLYASDKIDRIKKLMSAHEMEHTTFPLAFSDYFELVYDKKNNLFLFGKERWTSTRGEEGKKLFRGDKSYLGNRSVRVHSDESVSGKIFIEFVALIIRNRMYCQLKDEMEEYVVKPDYMTVPAAIRELEKIEMIRQMDGIYRLDHAITARQKKLYSRPKPSMKLPLPTWRQSWQGRMNLLPKTLLDAFKKRGKSYDAVMRYLKEGLRK